jgi:hypothetical protein
VLVFMCLIDHAARLLRPVNIVWRIAQQGRQVIDDVYPNLLKASSVSPQAAEKLGRPERTVLHKDRSEIVIAVNLNALVAEARKADVVIELVPRVDDFVATDDRCFSSTAAAQLRSMIAF